MKRTAPVKPASKRGDATPRPGVRITLTPAKGESAKSAHDSFMRELAESQLDQHWPKCKPKDGGVCKLCGCYDDRACPGGCSWVRPDLCSTCAIVFLAVVNWQDNALKPSLMRLHQAANRNPVWGARARARRK